MWLLFDILFPLPSSKIILRLVRKEGPNEIDLVAALKRLRNAALVLLRKYTGHEADFYDYDEQVNKDWFFCTGTFTVAITDEGRGLDVSNSPIGFKQPA